VFVLIFETFGGIFGWVVEKLLRRFSGKCFGALWVDVIKHHATRLGRVISTFFVFLRYVPRKSKTENQSSPTVDVRTFIALDGDLLRAS